MELRERVIVETYTGYCMTSPEERDEVYKYMAEIMGRPVFTHELADKEIQEQLREKAKPDFIALCTTPKKYYCPVCGNEVGVDVGLCPYCGLTFVKEV